MSKQAHLYNLIDLAVKRQAKYSTFLNKVGWQKFRKLMIDICEMF